MKKIINRILVVLLCLLTLSSCSKEKYKEAVYEALTFNNATCELNNDDKGCQIDNLIFSNINYSIEKITNKYADVSITCIDVKDLLERCYTNMDYLEDNDEFMLTFQQSIIDMINNNDFVTKTGYVRLYFEKEDGVVFITNKSDLSKIIIGNIGELSAIEEN